MKRNFWLAALVGVALTSCVSDEGYPTVESKQLLSFGKPVYNTQSRAVPGEIVGSYSEDENFVVFCRRYKNTFNGWLNSTGSIDFFGAEGSDVNLSTGVIANHAEGTTWAPETDYYWPGAGYNLAFAAYSPADLVNDLGSDGSVSYSADGLSIVGFSPKAVSEDQYDLMYSDRKVDCNNENYGKLGKAVEIKFHHALSSVVFAAVENVEGRSYKINSISLTGNFVTNANFKEYYNESAAEGTPVRAPKWESLTKSTVTYTPSVENLDVPTTAVELTGGKHALLLIPHDGIDPDAEVILSYTVKPDNGVSTTYDNIRIKLSSFLTSTNEPIKDWKINGRYVYTIKFGGSNKIFFTPSVSEWDDNLTAVYTIS